MYTILPMQHVLQALTAPQFINNDSIMTVVEAGVEKTMLVRDYAADYLGWKMDQVIWRQAIWVVIFICIFQAMAFIATTYLAFNKR